MNMRVRAVSVPVLDGTLSSEPHKIPLHKQHSR